MCGSPSPPRLPPAAIAHRLGAGLGAENSLAACRAALAAGFGALECDVKLSADGQAFLLHDDSLLRSHALALRASALPWSQLRSLQAGEAIASLPQLHAALRDGAPAPWLNLEIKPDADADAACQQRWGREIARQAAALWRDEPPPLLSSFSIAALQGALQGAPQLPRAWICGRLPARWREVAQALGLRAIHLDFESCSPAAVSCLAQAGLALRLYTVNDPAVLERWLRHGVAGVFTDTVPSPEALQAAAAGHHG